MTEGDKILVAIAKKSAWEDIVPLFDKAESEECKKKLHDILTWIYHHEEAIDGVC